MAVTVCKNTFDGEVYGSIRHTEMMRIAGAVMYRGAFFIYLRKGNGYVGIQSLIQKVASTEL